MTGILRAEFYTDDESKFLKGWKNKIKKKAKIVANEIFEDVAHFGIIQYMGKGFKKRKNRVSFIFEIYDDNINEEMLEKCAQIFVNRTARLASVISRDFEGFICQETGVNIHEKGGQQ